MVVHGGDLFHTPDVSNKFTGEIAKVIKKWGVDTYVVPGNHDLYGYNTATLYNTKLGLLASTGIIKILDRLHPLIIKKGNFKLGIDGQEYYEDIDKGNPGDFSVTDLSVDLNILVYHGMLLDHKFFSNVPHTLIDDVMTSADLVLAGHYHPGFDLKDVNGTTYCNPGSGLRIENTAENRANTPKVAVIDIDEGAASFEIKFFPYASAKKGEDVFVDRPATNNTFLNGLNQFHEKLQSSSFNGVNLSDMIDDYCKLNNEDKIIGDVVKEKINKFSALAIDNGYIPEQNNIYITKVEIDNFQAHKHKVIDFVNGLNVIKGESNSGKTAILRAIYWVLYDKPNGSNFIKTGAKSCRARLYLSNGYIIERKRSRSSSGTYTLIAPDGSLQEYKGFSNNIPIEITNAHQMPELKINGASYRINIASQLDQPFLVGNSSSEKISMIGSLVDADRADEAKKEFNLEKRRKDTEKKQLQELLKENMTKLEKFNYLSGLKKTIDVFEAAIVKLNEYEDKLNKMTKINNNRADLIIELESINNRLDSIYIPDKDIINSFNNNLSIMDKLYSLKGAHEQLSNDLNNTNNRLEKIGDLSDINSLIINIKESIDKIDILTKLKSNREELLSQDFSFDYDLDGINSLLKEYKENLSKMEEMTLLLDSRNKIPTISSINNQIDNIGNELTKIKEEKDKLVASLEKEDNICPYCKQKIDIAIALG